jgi:hypothetical protein
VGGLLSIDNLAKDLRVAFDTVKIGSFCSRDFTLFFVSPLGQRKSLELGRAVDRWKEYGKGMERRTLCGVEISARSIFFW